MAKTTREVRLASRPQGEPRPEDFEIAEVPLPDLGEGEVLVRNSYLSVDPYMRARMRDAKSYLPPFQLGEALDGGAVGQVVASRNAKLEEGVWVQGLQGWREHFVSNGDGLFPVDPSLAPVSTALGVLGMPGLTAYVGLTEIARLQEGDEVFVSAAAGAVGSVAGQLARLRGCRVVGSAGSPEKVEWVREELGFDAAFSYRDGDLAGALREHFPKGIDVYFDNVGGEHLSAALGRMRRFGRVAVCGAVSRYNDDGPIAGPDNFGTVLVNRLTLRGFIVLDHFDLLPPFLDEVGRHVRSGELRYRETILEGIEAMPDAFIGLFEGENIGKMLVRVGPDPGEGG